MWTVAHSVQYVVKICGKKQNVTHSRIITNNRVLPARYLRTTIIHTKLFMQFMLKFKLDIAELQDAMASWSLKDRKLDYLW